MTEQQTEQEKIFAKIVEDVTKNHRKIIDDWCKAYLAHLVQEGVELKPNCFTLFHKQPDVLLGKGLVHEYWFELKERKETSNERLLKQVMIQLNKLIVYVNDQISQCKEDPKKIPQLLILDEINGFLNFVDREE